LSKPNAKPNPPAKRRKNARGGAYWTLFVACALLSFGGGFWFTYQMTSQVAVKDPGANEAPNATPLPAQALVTPAPDVPEEEPVPSTSMVEPDPAPVPSPTPRTKATEAPLAHAVDDSASAGQGVYRVQVGSYSSREEAQAMVEELAVAGVDAMVVEDEGKFHAQIGAYGSRDRALSAADGVNTKGYSVTIRH